MWLIGSEVQLHIVKVNLVAFNRVVLYSLKKYFLFFSEFCRCNCSLRLGGIVIGLVIRWDDFVLWIHLYIFTMVSAYSLFTDFLFSFNVGPMTKNWDKTKIQFHKPTNYKILPISPVPTEKSRSSKVNFCTRCAFEIAFAFARLIPCIIASITYFENNYHSIFI